MLRAKSSDKICEIIVVQLSSNSIGKIHVQM